MSAHNVKVFFRTRNNTTDGQNAITFLSGKQVRVQTMEMREKGGRGAKRDYAFDAVWDKDSRQEDVYNTVGRPLLDNILDGYNSTLFVYGQTGSGKTYTMFGPDGGKMEDPEAAGIVPRLSSEMFQRIAALRLANPETTYTVKISIVDVYLEKVRDLLNKTVGKKNSIANNVKVRYTKKKGVFMQYHDGSAITTRTCSNYHQIKCAIDDALAIRKACGGQASTGMNPFSSRSHLSIQISIEEKNDGGIKTSKLMLCDLAGSEKVRNTGNKFGSTEFEQARNINYGLSVLGNVLNALTTKRVPPYMDSKLTRILMDSLGGNCKTTLICGGRPDLAYGNESVSTLRFGTNAKKIKNQVFKNEHLKIGEYKKRHREMQSKIADYERELKQAEKIKKYTTKLESFAIEQGLDVTEWAAQHGMQTMEGLVGASGEGEFSDSEEEKEMEGCPRASPASNAMYRRKVAELMVKLDRANEDLADMKSQLTASNYHIEQLDNENIGLVQKTENMHELGDEMNALQGSNFQKSQEIERLRAKCANQNMLISRMQNEQSALSMNLQVAATEAMNDYSQKELKRIHIALNSGDAQEICSVVTDMARQDQEIKRLASTLKSQQRQMEEINNLRKRELESKRAQESAVIDLYAKYKMDKSEHTAEVEKKDNTIEMLRRQIASLQQRNRSLTTQLESYETDQPVAIRQRYQEDPSGFFSLRASAVQKQMCASRARTGVRKVRVKRKSIKLAPVAIPAKAARTSLGMTSPCASA